MPKIELEFPDCCFQPGAFTTKPNVPSASLGGLWGRGTCSAPNAGGPEGLVGISGKWSPSFPGKPKPSNPSLSLLRSGDENGYNIPTVTLCPEVAKYLEMPVSSLAMEQPRDMEGVAKRLFCDAYMYMYQSKKMALYK